MRSVAKIFAEDSTESRSGIANRTERGNSPAVLRFLIFSTLSIMPLSGSGVLRWGIGAEDAGSAGAFGLTGGSILGSLDSNPAAMTLLGEGGWVVSTQSVIGRGEFQRGGERDRLQDAFGVLPEVGVVWKLPQKPIWVGASVIPVSALRADWGFPDVPGGIGGASFGQVSQASDFLAIDVKASVAWQLSEQWSIGASLGANYSRVGFDAPFIFQTNPTRVGAKVDLDLESDGWAPTFDFGTTYRPHENWVFGFRVKPPTVLENEGSATVDASAQFDALGIQVTEQEGTYRAFTRNELPLQIGLGASWQASKQLRIGGRVDWIRWSASFDQLEIDLRSGSSEELAQVLGARLDDEVPLRWEDRFAYSLGLDYVVNESWSLSAGWRYSESPLQTEFITPLNGAILEQALTFGVGYQHEDWRIDASYSYEFSSRERIGESGFLAGEFSNSELELSVHRIGLSLGRSF